MESEFQPVLLGAGSQSLKHFCPSSTTTGIMSAIVNNKPDVPPQRYRKVVCDIQLNPGPHLGGRCWLERHNE